MVSVVLHFPPDVRHDLFVSLLVIVIVIMNTDHYVKSCLISLSDPNFYEELPDDPTVILNTEQISTKKYITYYLPTSLMNLKLLSYKTDLVLLTYMAYLKYTKILTHFLLYSQYVVDSTPVLQSSLNLLTRF